MNTLPLESSGPEHGKLVIQNGYQKKILSNTKVSFRNPSTVIPDTITVGQDTFLGSFVFQNGLNHYVISKESLVQKSGVSERVLLDYLGIADGEKISPARREKAMADLLDLFNSNEENKPTWVDRIKSSVLPLMFVSQVAQATANPLAQNIQRTTPAQVAQLMPVEGPHKISSGDQLRAQVGGLSRFQTEIDGTEIHGGLELSKLRGSIALGLAKLVRIGGEPSGAIAIDFKIGKEERQILVQAGIQITEGAMLKVTFADLRQMMDFVFASSTESARASAKTSGFTLRIRGGEVVKFFELAGYHIDAQGHDFGKKQYTIETATLYSLYEQRLLVAGSRTNGIEAKAHIIISQDNNIRGEFTGGVKKTQYQTFLPTPAETHGVAAAKFILQLTPQIDVSAGVRVEQGTGKRLTLGMDGSGARIEAYRDSFGSKNFGITGHVNWLLNPDFSVASSPFKRDSKKRDTPSVDNYKSAYGINYSEWLKDNPNYVPPVAKEAPQNSLSSSNELLQMTKALPGFIPTVVPVRVDTTAPNTRLVEINTENIPANAVVDKKTGNVFLALPGAPGSILSAMNITTGASVMDSFSIEGNSLKFNSQTLLAEGKLATGINTIEVETTNQVIILTIEKGSVKILKIEVMAKITDAQTVATTPTISDLTQTSFKAKVNITDPDGVRNLSCQLQTQAGVNIGDAVTPINGECPFTGLTTNTNYKLITTAEVAQKDKRGVITWTTISREIPLKTLPNSTPVNTAPTLGTIADIAIMTGTAGSTTLIAGNDAPGNVLMYSMSNLPAEFSFDPLTRILSWTAAVTPGTINALYKVTDQGQLSDEKPVKIIATAPVVAVDTPESITYPTLNITHTEVIFAGGVITDLDSPAGFNSSITYIVKDDNGNIVAANALVAGRSYTYVVKYNTYNGATNTMVVGKLSPPQGFTTPVLSVPNVSFASTAVTKTAGDPNFTQTLTSQSPGLINYSSNNTSVATVHPTTGVVTIVGPGVATITANQGATTVFAGINLTYSLNVYAQNTAPTAVQVTTQPTVTQGAITANLAVGTLSCTDFAPTGAQNNCTYSIIAQSTPGVFALAGNVIQMANTAALAGNYTVTVRATDTSGATRDQVVNILISLPPDTTPDAYTIPPESGVALSTLITSASVTINGISAPAAISVTGSGAKYSINGGAFTATPGTITNGQSVRFQGTSSSSNSQSVDVVVNIGTVVRNFTITTEAPVVTNTAPTAITLTPATLTAASLTNGQSAGSLACTDLESTTCTYTMTTQSTPGAFSVSGAGIITVANTGLAAGTYTITVVATDGGGLTRTETKNIVVAAAADITAPSLTSSSSLSASNIGATIAHTLTFDESVVTATVGSVPIGMVASLTGTGASRQLNITTSGTFTAFGSVSIPITVTDAAGNSRTITLTKTINDVAPSCSESGVISSINDNGGLGSPRTVDIVTCTDTVGRTLNYALQILSQSGGVAPITGNATMSISNGTIKLNPIDADGSWNINYKWTVTPQGGTIPATGTQSLGVIDNV